MNDEHDRAFTDTAGVMAGAGVRSPFAAVNVARQRVRQLGYGAPPLVQVYDGDSDVTIAFEEMRAGYVRVVPTGRVPERDEQLDAADVRYSASALEAERAPDPGR